ncbi:MAG TPA: hypothetical protein P5567_02805 [Kiritimatiellia bacterium]|nr:hypothetical protein [Kiritimatiellia bacterium]HRZ11363.1 hypothetical protein [Kiritimatiellia bacterium]HSA17086.1 hypothetical protein [Kiritimatiellia bacterium]
MNESSAQVLGVNAGKLAQLLDSGCPVADWRPEELGALFSHQMTAPVQFDLAGFDPAFAERIRLLAGAQGLLVKSFRDLFLHPHPPAALLEAVKDFAKRAAAHREAVLPKAIARMLYYLSISAALVRCGRRITSLSNKDLLTGLRWALGQEWVEKDLHGLLEEGARQLESSRGEAT